MLLAASILNRRFQRRHQLSRFGLAVLGHQEPARWERHRAPQKPCVALLALHPERDVGLFERSFGERNGEPVAGLEDHHRLDWGFRRWLCQHRDKCYVAIGTLGESVAILHSALRAIHGTSRLVRIQDSSKHATGKTWRKGCFARPG